MLDSVLSFIGAERANASREQIAADANAFSAQQYANRYQTTVKDMQSAGLNPMLAYSQGAGSAPTGQQAQGIENSVATAVDAHNRATQRTLAQAQVANVSADTEVKQKQAALIEAQTQDVKSAERLKDTSANEATVRMASQINYGNPTQKALAASYWSQISVNQANLPKIASEIVANGAYASQARAAAFKAIQEGRITQADYQRALNAKNFEESAAGRAKPFTEYGLSSAQRAADVIRGGQQININAQTPPKPLGSGKISQRWKR